MFVWLPWQQCVVLNLIAIEEQYHPRKFEAVGGFLSYKGRLSTWFEYAVVISFEPPIHSKSDCHGIFINGQQPLSCFFRSFISDQLDFGVDFPFDSLEKTLKKCQSYVISCNSYLDCWNITFHENKLSLMGLNSNHLDNDIQKKKWIKI